MRARKLKNLDERFEWYAPVIEADPAAAAGAWRSRWFPAAREVRLDLGCGKGSFAVRAAQAEPDVLFVGMDYDKTCVAMAAKKALALELKNAVFALGDALEITKLFAPGELDCIHLNFSSPFPPAKYAAKRLTHVDRLMSYRDVLRPGAAVYFKTDSAPLYEFSLTQFELAGYDVLWTSTDLRAERPGEIASDYEERLVAQGAKVHAIYAAPGARPERIEQTAELSLAAYLPEDLDSLEYIPCGMEDTVRNFKNRRARQRARALRRGGEA